MEGSILKDIDLEWGDMPMVWGSS